MHSDTTFVVTSVSSQTFWNALFPLIGVLIGSLITYFTTQAIERKKWERHKQERYSEQLREAFSLALEWIPPIELALTEAPIIASSYVQGLTSDDHFRKSWPRVLSELAKKDLPMKFNVLIPGTIQEKVNTIVNHLDDFNTVALRAGHIAHRDKSKWNEVLHESSGSASALQAEFESLKKELIAEYNKTYQ